MSFELTIGFGYTMCGGQESGCQRGSSTHNDIDAHHWRATEIAVIIKTLQSLREANDGNV